MFLKAFQRECLCRDLLAACLEGESGIYIFEADHRKKLCLLGTVMIRGVELPCHLAFDESANLWASSGCEGQIPLSVYALSAKDLDAQMESSQARNSTNEDTSLNHHVEMITQEMANVLGCRSEVKLSEDKHQAGAGSQVILPFPSPHPNLHPHCWLTLPETMITRPFSLSETFQQPLCPRFR